MERGIAVTGMGIVSALGLGVQEHLAALTAGNSAISSPQILKTRQDSLPVGEVKITDEDLANMLDLEAGHSFTRAALLGTIAVMEAVQQAGLSKEDLSKTGFISATSVGGIDYIERYLDDFDGDTNSRRFIRAQHPGFTTKQIARQFQPGGYISTISTACSSSANSIMLGARMIKAGKLDRVIVGGTDCLSLFTLNGFNSLKILSKEPCRPFDEDREGLNLGEGAAWLVLEAEGLTGGRTILGRLCGYGNANDAFHQTASSDDGEGAYQAMEKAFTVAGISKDQIDYINAHGTATRNNDLAESRALKRVFGDHVPPFNSTKPFTGHTLAAAGAVEAVLSLLSIRQQHIFPGLNFKSPMKETGLQPAQASQDKRLQYVMSNSFGFGGNCTSLIFCRNED